MGSPARQAQYLNFTSEFSTDQVIFTKAITEQWTAGSLNIFIYNTGLNDYCLPLAIFSLNGQKWFNQGNFDDTQTYSFPNPTVSDTGVITVNMGETLVTQPVYIRLMCLAHPNQKPFDQAQTGSILSYKSEFNYMKIAQMGVIDTQLTANTERTILMDIPHNAQTVPNYRIFARLLNGDTYQTTVLSPNARPKIGITSSALHFDNYESNPFVELQAAQYFYVIYYD